MLRKSHLKSKIQHRIPEFEIIDNDETTNIGRIYPFSTDLEHSEYGKAVAVKLPQNMKAETKATLLMATLIVKTRLV
ncbi:unnamed protein product [Rotaria sordida]|uniref:Uncharacterized protein n=1 Tax=Rotaria sordida TaxID=392033 RepID=A0A814GEV7_9BILA|nr:unnamed protein product [Rotaria sordida]